MNSTSLCLGCCFPPGSSCREQLKSSRHRTQPCMERRGQGTRPCESSSMSGLLLWLHFCRRSSLEYLDSVPLRKEKPGSSCKVGREVEMAQDGPDCQLQKRGCYKRERHLYHCMPCLGPALPLSDSSWAMTTTFIHSSQNIYEAPTVCWLQHPPPLPLRVSPGAAGKRWLA